MALDLIQTVAFAGLVLFAGYWVKRRVPLSELRAAPGLVSMRFIRMPRLSVSPVEEDEEKILSRLSETDF